ncbi:Putative DNA-binding protein [Podospora comata]|uniref:DNA-binding protein n=1 Tax=Podospora comata TaxID=48703 RepID=A0ABY6S4C0_PODCO|nr:Putative DNA-binding protein [Podospora comata]
MSWDNGNDNWGNPTPAATSGGDDWGKGSASNNDGNGFGDDGFRGAATSGNGGFGDAAPFGGDGEHRGETGHNKADCPNPRKPLGACRRCGDEGHYSKDCPTAGRMTCNACGSTEHLRKECPDAGPMLCKNCGEEGHTISACENARKVDRSEIPDKTTDEAWELIKTAVAERDIDDLKAAVQIYVKSQPDCTYQQLESAFRGHDLGVWLIALERPTVSTLTNMDLQGNLGKKYTVSYRFSPNPARPREREGWPETEEERMERLADAGELVAGGLPKCRNCDQLGHISKHCKEDKRENERIQVKCYNCDEVGHRVRDCPTPRVDKFACKNCGQPGHPVAECPEPRSAEGVECRKCNETGHFSKDCPSAGPRGCRNCGQEGHMSKECTEPKNMDNVQCRNCDEMGHFSKECPKPRDWSRVECQNCHQKGHTKVRCPNPLVLDENSGGFGGGDDGFGGGDGGFGGGDGGFDNAAPSADDGGW